MRTHFSLLAVGVGLAALSFGSTAAAEISAAAFVGTGLSGEAGEDLMGFGVGARAGYTMLIPIYLGVAASLHQGTADDEPGAINNSMSYYGAEAGVQLELGSFGIRPYLMAGLADVETTRDVDGGFLSPYLGVGVTPYWTFLDLPGIDLSVGLDLRYLQTTSSIDNGDNEGPATALPLYLTVGASFL